MTDGLRLFAGRNQRRLMSHCRVPPSILVWLTQSARALRNAASPPARADCVSQTKMDGGTRQCDINRLWFLPANSRNPSVIFNAHGFGGMDKAAEVVAPR